MHCVWAHLLEFLVALSLCVLDTSSTYISPCMHNIPDHAIRLVTELGPSCESDVMIQDIIIHVLVLLRAALESLLRPDMGHDTMSTTYNSCSGH
jgi:hypothetical protein